MNISDLIAELLPIAESLFTLIDKIKTEAPDAWASVSAEYVQAAQAWQDAKLAAAQTATVSAAPAVEAGKVTAESTTETAHADVAPAHTLSSAEQEAAGIPLANYTKG